MMPHDDENQDKDMIASVLQKIVGEMHGYESDRIMPMEKKPGYAMGSNGIPKPNEDKGETMEQAEPENQDNQHEPLDPSILKELMAKADQADSDGSIPGEDMSDMPHEIQMLVEEKRKKR